MILKNNSAMWKKIIMLGVYFLAINIYAIDGTKISNLKWDEHDSIVVTMENDTGFVLDINNLFHTDQQTEGKTSYTHYPVVLGENFINQLKDKNISTDTSAYDPGQQYQKYNTLWSGIHSTLGGGWVHFVNSVLYCLESGQLELTNPLLKRPESKWKPKPMTQSFKRTKKWDYYIPVSQKLAQKEYKIREKEGTLGDIINIPEEYVDLFLNTNDKEYKHLLENHYFKTTSKIDLVKILLGAKYLGIPQIHFIKSMVLKSVVQYSISNPVPSVIVFDDIEAAVAMKLDIYGYHIESVAFKREERLSESEYEDKMKLLNTIVSGINEMNMRLFEKQLGKYYN